MSTKFETILKDKRILAASTVVVGLVLILFVYSSGLFPVAKVGREFISKYEVNQAYQIGKKLDPATDKNKVYDQVVQTNQKEQLLFDFKINRGTSVADELKYYKTGNSDQYNKLLNDYFSGKESLFEDYVVKTQVFDALLRIKYNSEFGENNAAYNKAQGVLDKLNAGQSFEELAKSFSDDKFSGQLGGDLGFVLDGQLLPELEKAVKAAKLGEVKKEIVVSRVGYHIIYPVETAQKDGQKVWHVKHILIQTSGYENWLASKLQTVSVHKFMGI